MKLRYPVIGVAAAALVAYSTIAQPQGVSTLVTLLLGSSAVSTTNPLPVAPVAGTATIGAVEIIGSNGVNKAGVNGLGQLAVDATVSASVTGFTSNNNYGTLTATGSSSASTALPSGGGDSVRLSNTGTTAVSCTFATGAATGLASNTIIQPGSSAVRGVGSWDHVACIDQTGSTSNVVVLEGGSGLGNDSGGGSSGGGGGGGAITAASGSYSSGALSSGSVASGAFASGAVSSGAFASGSIASGAMVDLGAQADTACATDNGTCSEIALVKRTNQRLTTLNTTLGTPMQATGGTVGIVAGSAVIGHVICDSGCSGSGGTSSNFGSSFPTAGTAIGFTDGTNMVAGHVGAVSNVASATTYVDALGVCQYLASAPTLTDTRYQHCLVDINGDLKVNVSNANTNGQATMANSSPVVIASNQSPVPASIDQTTPGTTNAVQPIAGATGGASTTGNIVANDTTAVVIKASAGTLYGVQLAGIGSAPAYLKIYNATSATCGSGTPVKRLMIPAASTAANGAGSNISFGVAGVAFGTGITYCVTTGIADNDTSAPAASTFLVNLDWK